MKTALLPVPPKFRMPLLVALGAAGVWAASASVFITNLGNTSSGADSATSFLNAPQVEVAQQFTVGPADPAQLTSITLNIGATLPGGTFHLELYSDAAGLPGTSLAALSGNTSPSTAGNYTYTTSGTVTLTQSVSYWVVAYDLSNGFSGYNINETADLSATTLNGWSLGGVTTGTPGTWGTVNTAKHALISITAVPEPSVMAGLTGLALAGFAVWRRR